MPAQQILYVARIAVGNNPPRTYLEWIMAEDDPGAITQADERIPVESGVKSSYELYRAAKLGLVCEEYYGPDK